LAWIAIAVNNREGVALLDDAGLADGVGPAGAQVVEHAWHVV
jgi:hypothetical protein